MPVQKTLSEYGGIVPRDIDDLISLAGVGRRHLMCDGKYL